LLARRLLVASAAAALPFLVQAQQWPAKPVRIIVPFPPGQSTDILARVMADQIGRALGQQVVVENRPGAGGSIGADVAAKAPPDGYTLLMVTISTHGIAPALYPRLPYDAQKDFAPIANIGLTPQVLMASLTSGITSVQDLIAKAKAGADLNYGSSGNGSASHLTVEMLKSAAGIKLTHVPFKGNADAQLALQGGDIQLLSDAIPGAVGPIKAGKAKAIGIAEPTPLALPAGPADDRRARRARRGRGRLDRPVGTGAYAGAHPRPGQCRGDEDPQAARGAGQTRRPRLRAGQGIAPGVRSLHRAREHQMAQDRPGRRREDRVRQLPN
jgi:tripartite-type tricarboxylate transporter receptor subunit TctC